MHRWHSRQFRQVIYLFLVSICLTLGVGAWLHPAQAQINQATVTEILDGNQVFIQGRQVGVNSTARAGQQVSTGASRAGLRFNNGAGGRLRPNTSLIIGQCVQIQQGGIIASGPTNACAGSVQAAARGTTFLMEVNEDGTYRCQVLEGSVVMTNIPETDPSLQSQTKSVVSLNKETIVPTDIYPFYEPPTELVVRQGQKVSISRNGQISSPELITADDIVAIVNGSFFRGFIQPLPGSDNLQRALQEIYQGVPLPNLRPPAVRGLF